MNPLCPFPLRPPAIRCELCRSRCWSLIDATRRAASFSQRSSSAERHITRRSKKPPAEVTFFGARSDLETPESQASSAAQTEEARPTSGLTQTLDFKMVYGGDDGARTRDLCRDSSIPGRNLLISGASVAPKSTEKHSKSDFSTVVRTVVFNRLTSAETGHNRGKGHTGYRDIFLVPLALAHGEVSLTRSGLEESGMPIHA
jgi:hypothetical protein